MTGDLFSKFGRVTYMAIFDCEWHSLTENVSYANLYFFPGLMDICTYKVVLKVKDIEDLIRMVISYEIYEKSP